MKIDGAAAKVMGGGAIVLALASYAWSSIQADLALARKHETTIAVMQTQYEAFRAEQLEQRRMLQALLHDRGIKID